MRHITLNIRLAAFLAVVVVAVAAAASFAPGARQAYAVNIEDPTGVFCADISVTLPGPVIVEGIILARFDYVPAFDFDPDVDGIQDVAISAVAYAPESVATCQTLQSELGDAPFAAQTAARPSLAGAWDNGTDTVTGSTCSFEVEFGGITFPGWTKIVIDFELDKGIKSDDTNAFSFDNLPYTDDTCLVKDNVTVGLGTIVVGVLGKYLDGPDAAKETFNSDWDKDGCTDWFELDPDPKAVPFDPFNPADCAPGVGGVAELSALAGASPDAAALSDSNAGLIAAAAAATAAGAVALGSAAAYARRRSDR